MTKRYPGFRLTSWGLRARLAVVRCILTQDFCSRRSLEGDVLNWREREQGTSQRTVIQKREILSRGARPQPVTIE